MRDGSKKWDASKKMEDGGSKNARDQKNGFPKQKEKVPFRKTKGIKKKNCLGSNKISS